MYLFFSRHSGGPIAVCLRMTTRQEMMMMMMTLIAAEGQRQPMTILWASNAVGKG